MIRKILFTIVLVGLFACTPKIELNTADNLIPKPLSVKKKGGAPFEFTPFTKYGFSDENTELEKIGAMFSDRVEGAFGYSVTKGGA